MGLKLTDDEIARASPRFLFTLSRRFALREMFMLCCLAFIPPDYFALIRLNEELKTVWLRLTQRTPTVTSDAWCRLSARWLTLSSMRTNFHLSTRPLT